MKQGLDPVISHTCGCEIEKRIVGCYSHVAMILCTLNMPDIKSTILISGQYIIEYFDQNDLLSDEDNLINE